MDKKSYNPFWDDSWYFPRMPLELSTAILMEEPDGMFMLIDAPTPEDFVFCVRDQLGVRRYFIETIVRDTGSFRTLPEGKTRKCRLYHNYFDDLATLIKYFIEEGLVGVPYERSVPTPDPDPNPDPEVVQDPEKVVAIYNYKGRDDEDLSFKENELLTIIEKKEEGWWLARDGLGAVGMIPSNYVKPSRVEEQSGTPDPPSPSGFSANSSGYSEPECGTSKEILRPKRNNNTTSTANRKTSAYDWKLMEPKLPEKKQEPEPPDMVKDLYAPE